MSTSAKNSTALTLVSSQIRVENGIAQVSSRDIAANFGKRHDNVLRAIENLECSSEFRRLNFEAKKIKVLNGAREETSEYLLTYDGCVLVTMGFTGRQAMEFKEAYIRAFNEMERQLRGQSAPLAYIDVLDKMVGALREQHAQLKLVAAEPRAEVGDEAKYKTIRAAQKMYPALRGSSPQALGRRATALSKEMGLEVRVLDRLRRPKAAERGECLSRRRFVETVYGVIRWRAF